jgi:hypothetical protein
VGNGDTTAGRGSVDADDQPRRALTGNFIAVVLVTK